MRRNHSGNPFERYADDIIVHCKTAEEAQSLKDSIENRFNECKLELHPNKTQIVHCKGDGKNEEHSNRQFDFLGYTFRPRMVKSKSGKFFVSFSSAISKKAANSIRGEMRRWKLQSQYYKSLEDVARWINLKLRGWLNYYGRYHGPAGTTA